MNSIRAPTICHRLFKILCQVGSHKFISWSGRIIGHSAQKEYARKYKIGAAAVQISETIRFISFRDDSFKNGQSNMRRFIYERSATNIRDWSLAYSFWLSPNWTQIFAVMLSLPPKKLLCVVEVTSLNWSFRIGNKDNLLMSHFIVF